MKLFQRVIAALMVVLMVVSFVPTAFAAEQTITIENQDDFENFVKNCTRDVWSNGKIIELKTDLDFTGKAFSPIPIFQGTFHGNHHTIQGISFGKKRSCVGLFRTLSETAVVENLIVKGTMEPQGSANQVGLLAGENYGTIRGCKTEGAVSGQNDVGGLVGLNGETGRVESCFNSTEVTGVNNAGGVAGQNLGSLNDCENEGMINTDPDQEIPNNVGGIAGLSRGNIRSCRNQGQIGYQHFGYNVGGIVGLHSGEIRDCHNTGFVQGRKDVGGVVGQLEPIHDLTYAPSPIDVLNDNLATLLDEMENLTDQVNVITDHGAEDVKAVNEALTIIQEKAKETGTAGREDFKDMSDELHANAVEINEALGNLNTAFGSYEEKAGKQLDIILDEFAHLTDVVGSDEINQVERAAIDLVRLKGELGSVLKKLGEQILYMVSHQGNLPDQVTWETLYKELKTVVEKKGEIQENTTELIKSIADICKKIVGGKDNVEKIQLAAKALNAATERFFNTFENKWDTVNDGTGAIIDLLKAYSDSVIDQNQSAADVINDQITVIQNRIKQMTDAIQEDNAALHATTGNVFQSLDGVRQSLFALNKKPELTVTDLSGEITEGPGTIVGSTSAGAVKADSNVGGIAGTVSLELSDDPEETVQKEDFELLSDATATVRAAILKCRVDGDITAKNDYGGGIAGHCETGAVIDCVARGTVETGGDYCGGITGNTNGIVKRCAALSDLTGESWVGGVAGKGTDITDCRTMIRADSDGEYQGAIAGQAEGTLTGNRYLLEDLAGLDGVDYAEKAQGLDFDSFAKLDHIPADFLTFSYQFVVNGRVVKEIPFTYGSDLDKTEIPQTPELKGQYGCWPEFPTEDLTRSMILDAQFEEPTLTLSSGEKLAEVLVQGTFGPDAVLEVEALDLPTDPIEGGTPVKAWSYCVSGSQEQTVLVRLRTDGTKHPAAAIQKDGTWVPVDAELDGSYLVFEAPVEGEVLLMETGRSFLLPLCGLGGGAALVAVLLIHYRKKKKQTPQGDSEAEDALKNSK